MVIPLGVVPLPVKVLEPSSLTVSLMASPMVPVQQIAPAPVTIPAPAPVPVPSLASTDEAIPARKECNQVMTQIATLAVDLADLANQEQTEFLHEGVAHGPM